MAEKTYHDRHGRPLPPSVGIANLLFNGPSPTGHFCIALRGYPDLGDVDEAARVTKADPSRCVAYAERHAATLIPQWILDGREPTQAWVVLMAARFKRERERKARQA